MLLDDSLPLITKDKKYICWVKFVTFYESSFLTKVVLWLQICFSPFTGCVAFAVADLFLIVHTK